MRSTTVRDIGTLSLEHPTFLREATRAATLDEVDASAIATRIAEAVGPDATVTIARPDAAGRLRVVWRERTSTPHAPMHRRAAFEAGRPALIPLTDDHALAALPLMIDQAALGVLEIVASERSLRAAWALLLGLAAELALTIQNRIEREARHREAGTLEGASELGSQLVKAPTAEAAVAMAVRFIGERFRVPVAGWLTDDAGDLHLASTRGMAHAKRTQLWHADEDLSGRDGEAARRALRERFLDVTGAPTARVFDADAIVLVVGLRGHPAEGSLIAVASLLADMLRLAAATHTARTRRGQLDMGLAFTAHELRGPLIGVRAALETMDRSDADPRERDMMRSSVRELDTLVDTTDALLRWAAGTRTVQPSPQDLMQVVRDAADSCRLETGATVIIDAGPERAVALVDREHIRTALANLLRNAAAYGYAGTPIRVRVQEAGERLTIEVSDEGPQIPAQERLTIFDPFVRGHVSGLARNGSGLGLFITRRIVEAHGGRIWVESDPDRTTFHVSLAIEKRSQQPCAS